MPHGLPLPADAADVHGAAAWRTASRSSTSCEQTPAIPDNCQWALFLRNHDELTLEMVTDEERDYMYRPTPPTRRRASTWASAAAWRRCWRTTAADRAAERACCSRCPGTPVIYYGDEIGMGDNIYLGDRNGVRTPDAVERRPQRRFLARPSRQPPVLPGHHGPGVRLPGGERRGAGRRSGLAAALDEEHDLAAQDVQGAGRGTIEFLKPSNRKVLPYFRRYGDDIILCVANLSRFTQPVELDLSALDGFTPVEMFGYTEFPPIGQLPYFLTLAPYAFYWFELQRPRG